MNNEDKANQDTLLEVLEGYAAVTPDGNDAEKLKQWIAAHPEHARDLVEFAVSRHLGDHPPESGLRSEEEKQAYMARARRVYADHIAAQPVALKGLFLRAEELSLKKNDFLRKIGISHEIVNYLEQGQIEYSSIPAAFVKKIADVLETGAASVTAFLNQGLRPAQSFHKNHSRPDEIRTLKFSEAVERDSSLTAEQKKDLLSM